MNAQSFKKTFYKYVISVNKKKAEDCGLPTINQEFDLEKSFDMYYISKTNIINYYNEDTGFEVKEFENII